ADYALANTALSRLSEEFQAKHPNCRCLALEWSIWSGVGMGERLGRVDALLHQGISPISSEAGVFWLKRLLGANTPVRVVVSGRLGPKPPLPLVPQLELPFWRFLENPRLFYPGIELVVEAELSPASDPYLDDHVLQGERLLPAVLGLEAMAQAACAVTGRVEVPAFEEVRFLQPIVVAEAGITLRLAALVRDQDTVEVVLRSSQSGFQRDCFRAIGRFFCPQKGTARRALTPFIPLDPKQDLYGKLLFQKGRFQRLKGYCKIEAFSCLAEIAAAEETNWFARYLPQKLLLGDPGSRDAAIHAVQSCIPQAQILPIGIERWLPGDLNAPGPWTVEANEHWQKGEVFCYELAVYGANGVLRERFEGLRLRRIGEVAHRSWPLALLAPYLERRVKELTGTSVRLTLGEDKAAIHRALEEAADIFRRPDGKPIALNAKAVSAAHAAGITLAAAGQAPVACDLEIVAERPWRELLGGRYGLAELIARQGQEDFNAAATRVWTAIECLKKGGFSWDTPVLLHALEPDRWAVLKAGSWTIASWSGALEGFGPVAVAILVAASP
ncbi:MAG: polyketide synthase dehydratase domain-containing protein, partial [Methylohalobius sp.]